MVISGRIVRNKIFFLKLEMRLFGGKGFNVSFGSNFRMIFHIAVTFMGKIILIRSKAANVNEYGNCEGGGQKK
jgi:hypothetical protein